MKKGVAFRQQLIYNTICVEEHETQKQKNARLAQLVEHLTLNLERKTDKSALEEKRHCFQRDWKQFFVSKFGKSNIFSLQMQKGRWHKGKKL